MNKWRMTLIKVAHVVSVSVFSFLFSQQISAQEMTQEMKDVLVKECVPGNSFGNPTNCAATRDVIKGITSLPPWAEQQEKGIVLSAKKPSSKIYRSSGGILFVTLRGPSSKESMANVAICVYRDSVREDVEKSLIVFEEISYAHSEKGYVVGAGKNFGLATAIIAIPRGYFFKTEICSKDTSWKEIDGIQAVLNWTPGFTSR